MIEGNMIRVDAYSGGCPSCGGQDAHLNVGYNHTAVCHQHKVRWYLGSNLFSDWKSEDKSVWEKNVEILAEYKSVGPIPKGVWPLDLAERAIKLREEEEKLAQVRDAELREVIKQRELRARVAAAVTKAIAPLAADIADGAELTIAIDGFNELVLTRAGVQLVPDIPF